MSTSELERLYDAHAPALFAFLLHLMRNESDTRDALQELFSRLVARPNLLRDVTDERGFLIRLAYNLAMDKFRREAGHLRKIDALSAEATEIFAMAPDPDEAAFRRELAIALGELPVEQRAVVHLKLWEGLTFDAISTFLEIPLNTAASRYRYGMDKLRGHLRPLYDEIRTR